MLFPSIVVTSLFFTLLLEVIVVPPWKFRELYSKTMVLWHAFLARRIPIFTFPVGFHRRSQVRGHFVHILFTETGFRMKAVHIQCVSPDRVMPKIGQNAFWLLLCKSKSETRCCQCGRESKPSGGMGGVNQAAPGCHDPECPCVEAERTMGGVCQHRTVDAHAEQKRLLTLHSPKVGKSKPPKTCLLAEVFLPPKRSQESQGGRMRQQPSGAFYPANVT